MNDDELINKIRDKIFGGDFDTRLEAAKALKRLDHTALETLIRVLEDSPDPILAWTAAERLGNLDDLAAVDPLLKALQRDSSVVRQKAAEALGRLVAWRAVDPLIRVLDDDDGDVRDAAAWALLEIGDPQALQPILWAVVKRKINLEVLAELGEDALQPLLEYLSSFDSESRAGAASALGELHHLSAVEPLMRILQYDLSDDVRRSAAFALGQIEDMRSFEPLIRALHDPFEQVRAHAARALGLLKSEKALEPLSEATKDKSPLVSNSAKWAINRIRGI